MSERKIVDKHLKINSLMTSINDNALILLKIGECHVMA